MKDQKELKTPSWLVEIVNVLITAEDFFPEPYWMQGDAPAWVQNVGLEVTKSLFPVANLKKETPWGPGEVAAMMGHKIAYWQWMMELMEAETKRGATTNWDELRRVFGEDIEERTIEYWRIVAEDFFPAFLAGVKFGLSRAIEQEYHIATKFFGAFSRALDRKPRYGGDIGRTSTSIYWVMLTSWRRVESLGSIPELHRRLCACVFLGSHIVGDLKRLEKICERMGLSYREIAERNKRAENPDIAA